jgi:3-hydroxybutyryl-CoA dehydratase
MTTLELHHDQWAIGDRLPSRTIAVRLTDVVRYAGASGDFNPLHHDPDAARAAGMHGPFAHGMYAAGRLATALTDAVGLGALTSYDVRFRSPAWIGADLATDIVVRERLDDEAATLVLDAQLVGPDGTPVVTAEAHVQAAPARTAAPTTPAPPAEGLVGTPLRPLDVLLEWGPLQAFAAALGDDKPAYRSARAARELGFAGIPLPSTFLFAAPNWGAVVDAQPEAPPDSMTLVQLIARLRDGRQGVILHGGQEFRHYAPAYVGDVVRVRGHVAGHERKPSGGGGPGMEVMSVHTEYRDGDGGVLSSARSTFLFRPALT